MAYDAIYLYWLVPGLYQAAQRRRLVKLVALRGEVCGAGDSNLTDPV